ncbi:MAG: metallophosphoesterase [Pseudoflavonifractor sp.]
MRKYFWGLLWGLLLLSGCSAGAGEREAALLPWVSEPVTVFVSADLHWQNDTPLPYLDESIDALLSQTETAQPAALILCGDLTNGGREEEHRALVQRLEEVRQAGLPIFVTMGNHDMDRGLDPGLLKEIYADFGYRTAISTDTDSMSYLAPLSDRIWLLSLDCNVYGEKESSLAGVISAETLTWVGDCLARAQKTGALVLPFSHHNLLVHNMNNEGGPYNIAGGDALAELLLDYGVPVYLSGHRHNSFLVPKQRGDRQLTELVSDMPGAYPHRYTALTLQPDSTIDYAVPALNMKNRGLSQAATLEKLRDTARNTVKQFNITDIQREAMERYFVDFYAAFQARRLWQEGAALRADPTLELWRTQNNVYARWIPWVLEHQINDNPMQVLGPYR